MCVVVHTNAIIVVLVKITFSPSVPISTGKKCCFLGRDNVNSHTFRVIESFDFVSHVTLCNTLTYKCQYIEGSYVDRLCSEI